MWQGFRDREQRREAVAREEKTAESLEAIAIMTPSAPFEVVQYCSDLFWHSGYVGKSEQNRRGLPMTPQPSDWRHLAEQASKEMDPDKLMAIVNELNRALPDAFSSHPKQARAAIAINQ
jgi:hypothetical protein